VKVLHHVHLSSLFPGNKCDLESLREVEFAEAEAMCEYIPEILFVLEASAKENTNIDDAFMCLATELKVGNYC
jgi:Ras family.